MMTPGSFDRYEHGQSSVHRLDPRVKVVVTVLFIVSNVLLPDGAWLAFVLAWGLVLLAGAASCLGPGYAFKRSFVALPFALAAVTAMFAVPGEPLAAWSLGPWRLVPTDAGLVRFATIVVRSWLSVQAAVLLVATTRFPDLIHALHHLYIPRVIVAIISFMYRYMSVLADETHRLLRARDARSARLAQGGGGTVVWRARVAGNMAGQLFLRSYERSERIYSAMVARGYAGQMLTMRPHVLGRRDVALGVASGIILLALQLLARFPAP